MSTKVAVKSIALIVDAASQLTGIQPLIGFGPCKYSDKYAKLPYKVLVLAIGTAPCIFRV
jgi:hypothetical protein